MEYFVIINAVKKGPYTFDEMVKKIKSGEVNGNTQVWHVGLTDWVHVKDIVVLRSSLEQNPPPVHVDVKEEEVMDVEHQHFGGFWRRVVAFVIDSVMISIITKIIFFVSGFVGILLFGATSIGESVMAFSDSQATIDWEHIPTSHMIVLLFVILYICVLGLVLPWIYYAWLESSAWQATVGKRVMNMKVIDLEGRRISFARATGRYFAKIISTLILFIGFFMIGWTRRKQGLHDKLADTLVVVVK